MVGMATPDEISVRVDRLETELAQSDRHPIPGCVASTNIFHLPLGIVDGRGGPAIERASVL